VGNVQYAVRAWARSSAEGTTTVHMWYSASVCWYEISGAHAKPVQGYRPSRGTLFVLERLAQGEAPDSATPARDVTPSTICLPVEMKCMLQATGVADTAQHTVHPHMPTPLWRTRGCSHSSHSHPHPLS